MIPLRCSLFEVLGELFSLFVDLLYGLFKYLPPKGRWVLGGVLVLSVAAFVWWLYYG